MNQNRIPKGTLDGQSVKLDASTRETLYDTSFYGRPMDDYLELTLIEAAYLTYKNRVTVTHRNQDLDFEGLMCESSRRESNFEVKYIVFKDLRERGYFIKPGVTDFRVYPRGGKPGKTPSKYFIHVLSERQPVPLMNLVHHVKTAANVRKELVMAVVDEESDITYYGVSLRNMKGDMGSAHSDAAIRATLLEDRVMVWDSYSSDLLHKQHLFGKPLDETRLQLSLIEAAYLQEMNIIEIKDNLGEHVLNPAEFSDTSTTVEADFPMKLAVYQNLRDVGMVVKTGYKFGNHFRVYKKVEAGVGMKHSEFLVHAVDSNHVFNLPQLSRAVRLANSVRKQMVFSWQSGDNIVYLELGRMKM
ncbi:MAG: tRNA-intron lyase [Methanosarcinales archaeon]|nr:tRNA-intron lyase [Methanosarcinales archaeon]